MSDSEEDYMSDKLLVACEKEDIRPGLLFHKKQKRTHEIYKKQIEARTIKKTKSYHEQEQETREKGLKTAIASDNIGFKMLQKMGYKAGASLGKSKEGIKEPVNIIIKENSSGVGLKKHIEEVIMKKARLKEINLTTQEKQFKAAIIERNLMRILRNDYFKAQRICEEFDLRNNQCEPEEDFFWSKDIIKKLKKSKIQNGSTEKDVEEEEEEEEEISDEKLSLIIEYLRTNYFYCIYCAITYNDKEELNSFCPGSYRIDHDDE